MHIKILLLNLALAIPTISLNCQATERDFNEPDRKMLELEAIQFSRLPQGTVTQSDSQNLVNKKKLFFKSRISLLFEKKTIHSRI